MRCERKQIWNMLWKELSMWTKSKLGDSCESWSSLSFREYPYSFVEVIWFNYLLSGHVELLLHESHSMSFELAL